MEVIQIEELIISDEVKSIEVMESNDIRVEFDLPTTDVVNVSTSCNCTSYFVDKENSKLILAAKTDLVEQVVPKQSKATTYPKNLTATVIFGDNSTKVFTVNAIVKKYE